MSPSSARASSVLLLTATLAFAGCGGNDANDDDAKQIGAVVAKALTTTDPDVKCQEVVTQGFVSKVYGDLAACKKAETPDPDDGKKPTGATTSGVKVEGGTATATVTVNGGDTDGATGRLSFEQEEGDWKVSDLGADFLRAQLAASLASAKDDKSSPFADDRVRACATAAFAGLDDAEFQAVAYSGIAEKPSPKFLQIITTCTSKAADDGSSSGDGTATDGEQSLLRRQFEEGIRQSAKKDGATVAQIDCVVKQLRKTISENEIIEQVGRGAGDVSNALAKKAAQAIAACG